MHVGDGMACGMRESWPRHVGEEKGNPLIRNGPGTRISSSSDGPLISLRVANAGNEEKPADHGS